MIKKSKMSSGKQMEFQTKENFNCNAGIFESGAFIYSSATNHHIKDCEIIAKEAIYFGVSNSFSCKDSIIKAPVIHFSCSENIVNLGNCLIDGEVSYNYPYHDEL